MVKPPFLLCCNAKLLVGASEILNYGLSFWN